MEQLIKPQQQQPVTICPELDPTAIRISSIAILNERSLVCPVVSATDPKYPIWNEYREPAKAPIAKAIKK